MNDWQELWNDGRWLRDLTSIHIFSIFFWTLCRMLNSTVLVFNSTSIQLLPNFPNFFRLALNFPVWRRKKNGLASFFDMTCELELFLKIANLGQEWHVTWKHVNTDVPEPGQVSVSKQQFWQQSLYLERCNQQISLLVWHEISGVQEKYWDRWFR